MQGAGRLQNRRRYLGAFCLGAVLLLCAAPGSVAQTAETPKANDTEKKEAPPKADDNKPWTGDSPGTPDRTPPWRSSMPQSVSGTVRLSSGEIPYPSAEIFWCGQPVGSTDKKGRFSVSVWPVSGGGTRSNRYCALSVFYPGTKPLSVSVPSQRLASGYSGERSESRSLEPIRLGTLILKRVPGFEGKMTSVTTLEAPRSALRAFQNGMREEAKAEPNLDKAAARYEEAVASYPRFAEAWTALGRVRIGLGDVEGAMPALEAAIAADESFPAPYRFLLRIRMQRGELAPAVVIATALLRLTPNDELARYFHALAAFGLHRYDEAAVSAQVLIDTGAGERFPPAFQILGEIHADRGEIQEAARNFRAYLALDPDAPSAPQIRERLSAWETAGVISPPSPTITRPFTDVTATEGTRSLDKSQNLLEARAKR